MNVSTLRDAALQQVKDSNLGSYLNPNDHAYFNFDGQRYMVQQDRPEKYTVFQISEGQFNHKEVLKIMNIQRTVKTAELSGQDLERVAQSILAPEATVGTPVDAQAISDQQGMLTGPSPFSGGDYAAGIGSTWEDALHIQLGSSRSEAVLRCLVASRCGLEVEVPEVPQQRNLIDMFCNEWNSNIHATSLAEQYLENEYASYAKSVAENDPMEFDDWLAGSDIPEVVKARNACLKVAQQPERSSELAVGNKAKLGFKDNTGTYYPSMESVRKYIPAGRTIEPAEDPLAKPSVLKPGVDQMAAEYIELEVTMRSKTTFGTDKETIRVWDGQSAKDVAERTAQGYGAEVVEIRNPDSTVYAEPVKVDNSPNPHLEPLKKGQDDSPSP